MNLPSLEQFLKAEKEKRIAAHRQGDLVGFKYTNETIYAEDWDEVTLNARGIVFNEKTGEIVARPFKKFFNYQEFFDGEGNHSTLFNKVPDAWKPNICGNFRTMEKVDGSLGIVFNYKDHWQLKTGGSFESEQAVWGQNWFNKNINCTLMNSLYTYCFEIISNEDRHPIAYDFEGLVLLGVINNQTGEEISLAALKQVAELLKVRFVQIYEFANFFEVAPWAKALPKTQEGVVVTFDNGFKTKLKGDEWCKLAKMFEGLNKWDVWVAYDVEGDYFHAHVDKHNGYKPIDDEVLFIPEELPDIREYAESVRTRVAEMTTEAIDIAKAAQSYSSERKLQFQYVNTNYPKTVGLVMKALDYLAGKTKYHQVKQIAHKLIQPPPQNTQN